jgi:hypothetical protein
MGSLSKRVGNAHYLNIRILVRIPAQSNRRIRARVAWLFFCARQLYQLCCRRHTVEIPWRYQEIILLSPRHLEHILCAMGSARNDLPTQFEREPKIREYRGNFGLDSL